VNKLSHSVTLQLHESKVVVSFIIKKQTKHNELQTQYGETPPVRTIGQYGRIDLLQGLTATPSQQQKKIFLETNTCVLPVPVLPSTTRLL